MLQGLRDVSPAAPPSVRQFNGSLSRYLWDDDEGAVHQGEGGEQGDPLMPLLFSLGQHAALNAVRTPASWASRADSLHMIRQRHPAVADRFVAGLERRHQDSRTGSCSGRGQTHSLFSGICAAFVD